MRGIVLLGVLLALSVSSPAASQECDEQVTITPGPGSIEVYHQQSLYNCCCSILFDVQQDSYSIEVHEYEDLIEGGCDCVCCFDAHVAIEGLSPGDYGVLLVKHTEYGGDETVGFWNVTVTGESAPGLRTAYLPCSATGATSHEMSWGVMKALYRGSDED
jgi:hypothetical protein